MFFLYLLLLCSTSFPVFADANDLVERLIQASHSSVRSRALEEMKALDLLYQKNLLPKLQQSLKDENPYVRQNAAEALGTLDQVAIAAAGELQQLKKDTVNSVRKAAAISLARMGLEDRTFIEELASQLKTQPAQANAYAEAGAKVIRYEAANALGFIGSGTKHTSVTTAIPALSNALLNDPDVDVRNRAAWALGAIGKEAQETLPALTAATHDPKVSYMASWAIKQIQK